MNCKGTEESILECEFDPWTKHDCRNSEWAGVECKTEEEPTCDEYEWRCSSGECISLFNLCDGIPSCPDESDERPQICRSNVEVRLSEGNNVTTGRIELKYKGVWGTICDDNFGTEEGQVVCRYVFVMMYYCTVVQRGDKTSKWMKNWQSWQKNPLMQSCDNSKLLLTYF